MLGQLGGCAEVAWAVGGQEKDFSRPNSQLLRFNLAAVAFVNSGPLELHLTAR